MNWRYFVAWVPSWGCFWAGHLFSKGVGLDIFEYNGSEDTWGFKWRYSVHHYLFWEPYQNLMHWSLLISDWGDVGLWKPESDEDKLKDAIEEIEKERGLSPPSND